MQNSQPRAAASTHALALPLVALPTFCTGRIEKEFSYACNVNWPGAGVETEDRQSLFSPKKVKEKRMETRLSLTILLSNLYSTNFSRVLASYD